MKCELIIEGLQDKQQFYNCCFQSFECKRSHDGTMHALYYTKQYAHVDAIDLKRHYPNVRTTIGTDFEGWFMPRLHLN